VTGAEPGDPDQNVTEVTLAADGDQTTLVMEERGMPVHLLAAYGGPGSAARRCAMTADATRLRAA
jgi:hypothetical protein